MRLSSLPYWKGWATLAFSLVLFLAGGPYWIEPLEHVQLPQRSESEPESTAVYPLLTIQVPPPLHSPAQRPGGEAFMPDTSRPAVLLFGDSMIEWVRFRLARWLKEIGYDLYVVLWPSSNLIWWAENDTLPYLIQTLKPEYIIVSIGGNELFIPQVEKRKPHMEKILQTIGSIPYIWVGPPNWAEDTGINDLIARGVGPGRYFASKRLTFERLEDGAHPTPRSSYAWADSIAAYLRDSALVPLYLPSTPPGLPYLTKPKHTCLIPPHPPRPSRS